MTAELTIHNLSWDRLGSDIALLCPSSTGGAPVAWRVIRRCGYGFSRPISLGEGFSLRLADGFGNFGAPAWVGDGGRWSASVGAGGEKRLIKEGSIDGEISVRHDGSPHSLRAELLLDGDPLLRSRWLEAGLQWREPLPRTLAIVAGRGFVEGHPLHPDQTFTAPLPIPLARGQRRHIVMIGGGVGPSATPLSFQYSTSAP